jgi:nucleotide-binding universal stress UspA family protein
VARTGIAEFIIGNMAERMLQRLICSILTVKPNGFQTPIFSGDA